MIGGVQLCAAGVPGNGWRSLSYCRKVVISGV